MCSSPRLSANGFYIVYADDANGNYDIFMMNVGSGASIQLTSDPADDSSPALSPDGTKVFISDRSGLSDVWIMNADGSSPTNLTDAPSVDDFPAFNSEGSLIADHIPRFQLRDLPHGGKRRQPDSADR